MSRAVAVAAAVVCVAWGAAAPAGHDAGPPASTRRPHKIERTTQVMGTLASITIWSDDDDAAAAAIDAAFTELHRIETLMTSWTDDSVVARINTAAGTRRGATVDDETLQVLHKALAISKLTDGAFDVTIGVFHDLWKFGSNQTGEIPSAAAIAERVRLVDYRAVRIDARRHRVRLARKGMAITLGGIAKGYAVDRAATLLRTKSFHDFIIQAGGDLYVAGRKGDKPWIVGIRDPRGSRSTPFVVTAIEDRTFSTSGDYERAFVINGVRYHHILDPATGRPARRSRSVTVMTRDALTADALSTALFVLGARAGMTIVEHLAGVEAVFVDADNHAHVSSGLRGKLQIVSNAVHFPASARP